MPAPETIVEVALDDAIQLSFDYEIPEALQGKVQVGMRVKVPVRGTLRLGTILSLKASSAFEKLLPFKELLSDKVFLTEKLFKLARWMSDYYCTSLDKVVKTLLPPSIRGKVKEKEQLFIQPLLSANALAELCAELRKKGSPQANILDVLLQHPKGVLLSKLLLMAKASRASIDSLVKKNVLFCKKVGIDRSFLMNAEFFPTKPKKLNSEQSAALTEIQKALDAAVFETRLLYGITGSGKTEVYLQAIEHALKAGKGALFLVPEIALTSQMIERLKGRFSEKIAILHSKLSDGERHDAWHHILEGRAKIVIGARSTIFSPVPDLGLIIVDEEHEPSYKQAEELPAYHARDVAVMRGKLENAVVLLGSATPSLESFYNAKSGKYKLSCLHARAQAAHLPEIRVVDMRLEFQKAKGFTLFSDLLLQGIKERVAKGEQVLLFLNRRGYHSSLFCPACSSAVQCPHCDINLTFHLSENHLACHLCDYRLTPPPRECPKCRKEKVLKFKGAGTELVERTLHALLPEIRTLRLDADTTKHKGSHELLFKQFRAGKADVLIGTQMVAKGLHFPSVTLVGILNADASLQIPDFRAQEHVFQLLTQVSGRAGRGALEGEVLIQTHLPDHPVIALAKEQDYSAFFAEELSIRELFGYPPFLRLVKLQFIGKDKEVTLRSAQEVRQTLLRLLSQDYELLPVVPCGYARIQEEYRFQFLIKAKTVGQLLAHLKKLTTPSPRVRIFIDVDPSSTYA